jgi:hypothetical protein
MVVVSIRCATLLWSASACLAGVAACSGGDAVPEAGPQAHGSFALIHVERGRFDGELLGNRYEHFEVIGRIARFAGIDRERVASILGIGDLDEPIDLDACEAPAALSMDDDLALEEMGRAAIELVDVGPIEMHAGGQIRELEPQSFPGLLNVLSGAVYGTDERDGTDWNPGQDYAFLARGGSEVGAFEAIGSAPDELNVVKIGGDDPTLVVPTVDRGLDLPVRWEPGDSHDTVRIDLTWDQLGTNMGMSCTALDDGSFSVPASMLRQVPDGAFAASPRLTVRRVRRRPFVAPGLDEGILLFDLSEAYTVRIR